MPSRTKSFKYCSRRRKDSCKRAKKTCSYKAKRTPKCQPRKQPKAKAKKSGKKSHTKSLTNGRYVSRPPRHITSKKCRKLKSKESCKDVPECAFDPRKNPKCDKHKELKHIWEMFVDFKALKFNYPITKQGIEDGMFVLVPVAWEDEENNDGELMYKTVNLYLRYSKMLLHSMKTKHANALRKYWYEHGEQNQEKYLKLLSSKEDDPKYKKWAPFFEAMSYRIGDPLKIKLTKAEIEAEQGVEEEGGLYSETYLDDFGTGGIYESMQIANCALKLNDDKKQYKEIVDDYEEEDVYEEDGDRAEHKIVSKSHKKSSAKYANNKKKYSSRTSKTKYSIVI